MRIIECNRCHKSKSEPTVKKYMKEAENDS